MNTPDTNEPFNHDFTGENLAGEDLVLLNALQDVPIPDGLESRLLAAVANEPTVARRGSGDEKTTSTASVFSRRAWLTSAAGLAGVSALGGLAYSRRKLGTGEVVKAVNNAWHAKKWSKVWQEDIARAPLAPPRALIRPRGWQYLATNLDDETVTFDMTLPGRPPAVLFAATMWRDISHFPTAPPPKPLIRSGPWSHVSIWRKARVLYVLASQGTLRDHQDISVGRGTVLFG